MTSGPRKLRASIRIGVSISPTTLRSNSRRRHLAACGYQAERSNHHFRVIDSLPLTLGTDAATVRKFDIFRKKRNISDYERAGTVSAEEAREMSVLAQKLREDLVVWLDTTHPELKP